MSTQVGEFAVGTVGLDIHIQITETGDDNFDFNNCNSAVFAFTKPDGTLVTRTLTLPADLDIPTKTFTYTLQANDLSLPGAYSFALTMGFSSPAGAILTEIGSFTVSDVPESLLVVEDGTGLATANSYATLEEANKYHQGNLYGSAWTAATAFQREVALMMATRVIDTDMIFRGWRRTTGQTLEWPRIKAKNDDIYGLVPGGMTAYFNAYYDENSVPARLKQATAQVALDLLVSNRIEENSNLGVKSIGLGQGAISLTFDQASNPGPLTADAQRLLVKLGQFRTGGFSRKLIRVS